MLDFRKYSRVFRYLSSMILVVHTPLTAVITDSKHKILLVAIDRRQNDRYDLVCLSALALLSCFVSRVSPGWVVRHALLIMLLMLTE